MRNRSLLLTIAISFSLFVLQCSKDDSETIHYSFPLAEDQDINAQKLEQAYVKAENIQGLKSLLVSRNEVLVSEAYFSEMDATDLYHVRSVTKSVISALIGIAINEGFIDSIGATIDTYLSPLGYELSDDKSKITIENLLTMSSGFEWEELINVSAYNDWVRSPDQIDYIISKQLEYLPGERFTYNSATAHLLSVILTEATNMSTNDFALEYLFNPLGMTVDDFGWGQFEQGYFNGGADLTLKPTDMVAIGNLYLNKGAIKNNQIIPSTWIEASTEIQITANNSIPFGPDYGYLWWINHDLDYDLFFANGYGGQFIIVVPVQNLVLVATSEFKGLGNEAGQQWYNVISLLINDILDCVE